MQVAIDRRPVHRPDSFSGVGVVNEQFTVFGGRHPSQGGSDCQTTSERVASFRKPRLLKAAVAFTGAGFWLASLRLFND